MSYYYGPNAGTGNRIRLAAVEPIRAPRDMWAIPKNRALREKRTAEDILPSSRNLAPCSIAKNNGPDHLTTRLAGNSGGKPMALVHRETTTTPQEEGIRLYCPYWHMPRINFLTNRRSIAFSVGSRQARILAYEDRVTKSQP
jgi:hypothetical protein